MKLITPINQHIPVWSVIKGDHACTDHSKLLHESLIKTPDFTDPRENALRLAFLKETNGRRWVHDAIENRSFALVELERKDVEEALTVWENVPLLDVAKEYKKAYREKRGINFKKIKKEEYQVVAVRRRQTVLEPVKGIDWLTNYEESYDYHRTIWVKKRFTDRYQIIDGTHRALATTWRYLLNKGQMPKSWYAIMCVH